MTHYGFDEIFNALEESGVIPSQTAVIHQLVLEAQDTAVHPGSTKWVIAGPGKVRYICHPDGGVDVTILEGTHRKFAQK
ncbi:hypothetical protein AB0K16_22265 [Nonomuraea jabiensis]|uniref:hypothetical protein n=1 Tax=Nonomuraea jabiensis TaxID=882448 RepID=UPI0034303B39